MLEFYDLVIMGAGPVGWLTALAFQHRFPHFKIALIGPEFSDHGQALGVSHGLVKKMQQYKIEVALEHPIKNLILGAKKAYHISSTEPLGYQIFPKQWKEAFFQARQFRWFADLVIDLTSKNHQWILSLQQGTVLATSFLIGTDGSDSFLRRCCQDDFDFYKKIAEVEIQVIPREGQDLDSAYQHYCENNKAIRAILPAQKRNFLYQVETFYDPLSFGTKDRRSLYHYRLKQQFYSNRAYLGTSAWGFTPTLASGLQLSWSILEDFLDYFSAPSAFKIKHIERHIFKKQLRIERMLMGHRYFLHTIGQFPPGLLKSFFKELTGQDVTIKSIII